MRRDTFIKSLLALTASAGLPLSAQAAASIKMMIPANPGGGWDGTGRAFGKAMLEAKVADNVQFDNKGGAAGVIGLAQFVNASKGDPNALIVMGAVMLGGIITGKPQVSLDKATPIARLTSEYNVFVVPAASPIKTMKEVVEQLIKDPGSVKWGGGSRGTTEHICASMLATKVGVDPKKVNYVAFRGGGEATAAILGGNVTVGGGRLIERSRVSEMLGNWRGLYGAPGITPEQRAALTELVIKATKSKAWTESLEKNAWTPALMTGKAFDDFVDAEFSNLRGIMHLAGMV